MPKKRTMTLNLPVAEMEALEAMAEAREITKSTALREALRLYQLILARTANGEKLYFEEDGTKIKTEMVIL